MREIPPEVLSSIFTLVVENNCFGMLNPRSSQQVGASFLTKICTRWRAVALNTSEIWARICIRHDFLDDQMMEEEQGRLRLCMGRAKSFPLSVEIVVDTGKAFPTGEHATLLRLTEKSNWGSLIVRMGRIPPDVGEAVLEMMESRNLESLRRLEVQFDEIQGPSSWQATTTFPNLRTLRLQHIPVSFRFSYSKTFDSSIFPYSQLTHIHLGLPRVDEILEILQVCCRSVRSVQIDLNISFHLETVPPSISFPFLDSLVINSHNVLTVQTFITTFTTPSLKSLSLSCLGMYYPRAYAFSSPLSQALTHFLERSRISTTLQKLHLSIHSDVDSPFPGPLMDVLNVTTGLEELFLSVSEHGKFSLGFGKYCQVRMVDFLQALARDDNRFLPKLKHLHIDHIDHSDPRASEQLSEQPEHEWVNEFEAMIKLRSAHELRSVILEIESARDDKSDMGLDLERLRRLEEASGQRGLAIRVVKTCKGKIHHEVLGYGSVYHH